MLKCFQLVGLNQIFHIFTLRIQIQLLQTICMLERVKLFMAAMVGGAYMAKVKKNIYQVSDSRAIMAVLF